MLQGTVGPYRVLQRIGRGGSGDVYKAVDSRLDRPVAIKAIREDLLANPDATERLRREALLAASIDHPYVCTIYELLEIDGQTLLAMEYIDGKTLHHALKDGPFEVGAALRFAAELAEALEEVHARGLVLRDLKPANIMITAHGHVKVMDFGIAKPQLVASDDTPTALTMPGVIVGTPRYMAPEQATGGDVDARTDVFAFGLVMFELLTGGSPFAGEGGYSYVGHLLADPPLDLPESIPERLRAVVGKALNKPPEDRFADGAALRAAIDAARRDHERPVRDSALERRRTVPPWATILLGAATIVTVTVIGYSIMRPPITAPPVPRSTSEALVTWRSNERAPRLSPDNQLVSFVSDRGGEATLWVRPLAGGDPRAIDIGAPIGSDFQHLWSPGGTAIAYLLGTAEDRFVQVLPLNSSVPRLTIAVQDNPYDGQLVGWTETGIYYLLREPEQGSSRLFRIDDGTGELDEVVHVGDLVVEDADISADGSRMLASVVDGAGDDLWIFDLTRDTRERVTDDDAAQGDPRWLGSSLDAIVYLSNEGGTVDLWWRALASGTTERLFTGVNDGGLTVSRDGSVVLVGRLNESGNLVRIDAASGQESLLTSDTLLDLWPSTGAGSDRIVFQRARPSGAQYELFDAQIMMTTGAGETGAGAPATTLSPEGFAPQLSPDGEWVAFVRTPPPGLASARLVVNEIRLRRDIEVTAQFAMPGWRTFPVAWIYRGFTWAPSGRALYFLSPSGGRATAIERLEEPLDDPRPQAVVTVDPEHERIRELAFGNDSSVLTYSVEIVGDAAGGASNPWEIRLHDGSSGSGRTLWRDTEALAVHPVGWLRSPESLVVARVFPGNTAGNRSIEIVVLSASEPRVVGRVEDARQSPLALDSAAGILYLTRVERDVHNLYALVLETGEWVAVTKSVEPGISFGGLLVDPEGRLLFSKHERNWDIWAVHIEPR